MGLWLSAGLVLAVVFALLWIARSPQQIIDTPHFTVRYPGLWRRHAITTAAILELCRQVAIDRLERAAPVPVQVLMGLSWSVGFRTYGQLSAIQFGFLLHPWVDSLFLNVNLGICHEFGHLVGPVAERETQEAWAHFFSLYALRALSHSNMLSRIWRLVLRRDYVLARAELAILQHTWGSWKRIAKTALLLLAVMDRFGPKGLNRLLDGLEQPGEQGLT